MKFIATDVDDSISRMQQMATSQLARPGYAIDRYFYRSHVTYQYELESIVLRSWLYAGHVSEIPAEGDYFLFTVGEEQLIIVRHGKDDIRALINVCRHRGSRVCEQSHGNRKSFVCPYHGWSYATDGRLKSARHMALKDGFKTDDYDLKQARIAVRFGLIFVNFDADAYDFGECLKQVDAQLGPYKLETAKIAHRQLTSVEANWKLVLDNYLECYHCATAHRSYAKSHTLKDLECNVAATNQAMLKRAPVITGNPGIENSLYRVHREAPAFGACIYTSRYALYEGYKSGTRSGEPAAPLMGEFKGFDGGAGDFNFGPLSFMLNYPDHCVLYRFIPRGITATDMEIVWFVNGDAVEDEDYDVEELIWLWRTTTLEDKYIISRNSEGVNSTFFEPGPYHPEFEESSMHFIDWYLHALAGDFSTIEPSA